MGRHSGKDFKISGSSGKLSESQHLIPAPLAVLEKQDINSYDCYYIQVRLLNITESKLGRKFHVVIDKLPKLHDQICDSLQWFILA